jgi:hypothetical protein
MAEGRVDPLKCCARAGTHRSGERLEDEEEMTPSTWFKDFSAFVEEWTRKREAGRDFDDEYIGDNPFPRFILGSEAKSWDDFLRWVAGLEGRWYFRGQREATWGLHTSLDRGVERIRQTPHSFTLMHLNRQEEMRPLLARFQQDAHNFLPHIPALDDLGSWYALMQHYCAPTPLLDWTESHYVGAYFAVEEKASLRRKRERDPHCALWAVDADWLEEKKRELFKAKVSEVSDSNELFKHSGPLVVRINPSMSNPRLFAQQGVFLCKLIDGATFAQLLMTMMMHEELTDRPVIRKLEIGRSLRISFMKKLRAMNIHRASLFPGLDGLGTLLKLDLELKDRD